MIYINLKGGLGNQMFQYTFARNIAIETNDEITVLTRTLSNKGHEIYSLDKLNIDPNTTISDTSAVKLSFFARVIWKILNLRAINWLSRRTIASRHHFESFFQPLLNQLGIYLCTDGYIKQTITDKQPKYLDGYFQSLRFSEQHFDVIKEELRVKSPVQKINQTLYNEMLASESVCVHIRRGDYTTLDDQNHLVCDIDYYIKAITLMQKKVKKPKFFIFSDDIKWVKEHIKMPVPVIYNENNNTNFEELQLMYSCKHFIISNSSFSWWAQLLCDNKDKVVISPSIWYRNPKQKVDLILDYFTLIDVVKEV